MLNVLVYRYENSSLKCRFLIIISFIQIPVNRAFFQGKMKYKESVTEGFENTVPAFIGLFKGQNVGKAIVKI